MTDELTPEVREELRAYDPDLADELSDIEGQGVSFKLIPATIGDYDASGMKADGWKVFAIWGAGPTERVAAEGEVPLDALLNGLVEYSNRMAILEGQREGHADRSELA